MTTVNDILAAWPLNDDQPIDPVLGVIANTELTLDCTRHSHTLDISGITTPLIAIAHTAINIAARDTGQTRTSIILDIGAILANINMEQDQT